MPASEIAFWGCFLIVLYPYLLYPLAVAVAARLFGRSPTRQPGARFSVSFVVCAHNEQSSVERRLVELIGLLETNGIDGEILLVSDGSTDDTAAVARLHGKRSVRVLELPQRVGKAEALSRGVAEARNEIIVFADVRQTWAADALPLLLENFADPCVGAVSGDLVVMANSGVMSGVGLYWRYEKWLRQQESRLRAQVGVTGAISAVRRSLFRPIPAGTVLDDVHWPLQVAMQGFRVVHDSRALAYDRLPDRARDEFRRKVRTLAGNFQLAVRVPAALLPWRNPIWIQWISHKLMRLVVPWALIGLFAASILHVGHPLYRIALACQVAAYTLGLAGLLPRAGRISGAAASFLVLNTAAWVGFWVWISGRTARSWGKVRYHDVQRSSTSSREPSEASAS